MNADDPSPPISDHLTRITTDDHISIDGALADARDRRIGVLFLEEHSYHVLRLIAL